jgi:GT2 family glycosyltransferase
LSRPEVSVVMPFAGSGAAAQEALGALRSLDIEAGDELILVDNSGTVPDAAGAPPVTVIPAPGERSPAHARNVGAAHATRPWILFLDADTRPRPGLLSAFWAQAIGDDVGAVAGEIVPAPEGETLAARYGGARSFLGQEAHREHPFRPRAAAANLLVRRSVFEQLGGFYEGLLAAEDTDFTWRLQEAGWRLDLCRQAQVEHHYRSTVRELRRQWRSYAAGRAWLARRYDGFVPEPAVRRAARRGGARLKARARGAEPAAIKRSTAAATHPAGVAPALPARTDRGRFFALDALLSLDELAGLALSNRPGATAARRPVAVVLVAEHFPAREDPMAELADSLGHARVEARARPREPDQVLARRVAVDYLEDDGQLTRLSATGHLVVRHPWRSLLDLLRRSPDEPPLHVLAPAVRRLENDPGARVHALGPRSRSTAGRLASLAGRSLD